jgi:hypothetical protein
MKICVQDKMNYLQIIDLVLKEARVDKAALLQEQQINNMVNQFIAKHKMEFFQPDLPKIRKKYLKKADELNKLLIKKLTIDFKTEKQLLIWLLEQIKNLNISYSRLTEDAEVIINNLKLYFENKSKINKNFLDYDYSALKIWVKPFKKGGEEAEYQEFLSKPIFEGKGYKIYKVTSVDQCIKIGKGTSWCIQGEEWAQKYLNKGPLYLVTKKDKRFALLSFESEQFMDIDDLELDRDTVREIFDIWPEAEKLLQNAKYFKPEVVKYLSNPSEELQLKAVGYRSNVIEFIENPTEKVLLKAVLLNGNSITYIHNPSEKIQLEAVKSKSEAIRFIENPSEKVQIEAVSHHRDEMPIKFIKNPSEKVQLAAVGLNVDAIKHIKNPTEKVKTLVKDLKKIRRD